MCLYVQYKLCTLCVRFPPPNAVPKEKLHLVAKTWLKVCFFSLKLCKDAHLTVVVKLARSFASVKIVL